MTLLVKVDPGLDGNATHYKVWDQYQSEPASETALPAAQADGYYHIPFKLSTSNTKARVYVKVSGGGAVSPTVYTDVTLVRPLLKLLKPGKTPVGSNQPVIVTGDYFGDGSGVSSVTFGGVPADVTSWTDEKIECLLPMSVPLGKVNVVVTSADGRQSLVIVSDNNFSPGQFTQFVLLALDIEPAG